MSVYACNITQGKKKYRNIRKYYRRWNVGTAFFIAFVLLSILIPTITLIHYKNTEPLSLILVISFFADLMPVLMAWTFFKISRSGGLIAIPRREEKLYFDGSNLILEFIPSQDDWSIDIYKYVKLTVNLNKVTSATYNTAFQYLRLDCEYTVEEFTYDDRKDSFIDTRQGMINIFDHYENFDEAIEKIEKISGIKIVKENEPVPVKGLWYQTV